MEKLTAHLQMIQGVINRMGSNSFAVKGWSITLTAAIFALATAQEPHQNLLWIPYFPAVLFWLLDAFFLRQERLFRKLYNHVRGQQEEQIDFSMDTTSFAERADSLIHVVFSKTLLPFHGSIMLVIVVVQATVNGRWSKL